MPPGNEPDANDIRSDNAITDPPGDTERPDTLDPAKDVISENRILTKVKLTRNSLCNVQVSHWYVPFGERILFLVRLPLIIRGLRIGRGVFRRPKYRAKIPNKTTPVVTDTKTT